MAIRGERRPVQKNIKLDTKLHNRFDVEVKDAKTGEIKQRAVGYNTILNQFWTRLFAGQSVYDYIQYGSGSGTPSAADIALFNFEGGVGAGAYSYDDAHYLEGWNSFTRSIVLDEQTAVGVTITEVGLAGASNSALCTHAMLQDMNGNSITITKTDTDILTIYATVYIHWNVNGSNGVKYIPSSHWFGTTPNVNYRVFALVKGFTSESHSTSKSSSNSYSFTGDASTKTWSAPTIRFGVNDANCYGCGGFLFGTHELNRATVEIFQVDLRDDHQITNEAVGTGDGTTTTFDLQFDLPYDVSIYVDGVLQSGGYTVYDGCHYKDVGYFEKMDLQSTPLIHTPTMTWAHGFIYYNPHYQSISVTSVVTGRWRGVVSYLSDGSAVYASDDMQNWTFIAQESKRVSVPQEYQHCKYWKEIVTLGEGASDFAVENAEHAIVFDNPPPVGAVITADYKTPFVPKDENHIYDIGFTIQLGEYMGV